MAPGWTRLSRTPTATWVKPIPGTETAEAQAAAFVHTAITRAGTPAATQICGDVYLAAPAGSDRATMYVIDGNDVVAAELSHDATASSDLTTQSQGLVLILPGLTDAGCNN